jgi:hypothetical protein
MTNPMRSILLILFAASMSLKAMSQSGVCSNFHKKHCERDNNSSGKWNYNAQSKSGLFNQGMVSKLRCVIYKGMDYRISVCCETVLGDKLNYKIFDGRTNELLFDNSSAENTQVFEFQSLSTRQLVIEVMVPQGATEKDKHKATDAACVGLLIENRVTDRQGFSSY